MNKETFLLFPISLIAFSLGTPVFAQSSPADRDFRVLIKPFHLTEEEQNFVFDQALLLGWARPCGVDQRTRKSLMGSLGKWIGDTGGTRVLTNPDKYQRSDLPTQEQFKALGRGIIFVMSTSEGAPPPKELMTCEDVVAFTKKLEEAFSKSGALLTYEQLKKKP